MSQRLIKFVGSETDDDDDDDSKKKDLDSGAGNDQDRDKSTEDNEHKNGDDDKVSRRELEAVVERMKAADRRASDAERKAREYEDRDKSELEKAQRDLAETTAAREKLESELRNVRIQNAFLSNGKHKWRNPATALRLADLDSVKIGDDGKVIGLDAALDALAKSDPYLLQGEKDGEDTDGEPSGGGKKRSTKQTDRETLRKKYPILS